MPVHSAIPRLVCCTRTARDHRAWSDRWSVALRHLALLLLLSSALLPHSVQAQEGTAATPTVAFPGNYGQAIGRPSWAPDDAGVTGSDDDGDGVHTLTVMLPRGSYEFKVALNGSWDENFGLRGEADGENILFNVPEESEVVFSFDVKSKAIGVTVAGVAAIVNGAPAGAAGAEAAVPEVASVVGDGEIDRAAILHASRSDLYRSPFGAQPFDVDVTLRLRTAHNDVEQVLLLVDTLSTDASFSLPMARVASDGAFDWWEAVLNTGNAPVVHNYKFQAVDGGESLFYADDITAGQQVGGEGIARQGRPLVAAGWDLYVYDPAFETPAWARDAVIYQIFPDRFRNGDPTNDPQTGDFGYPEERGEIFPISPWNTIVPDVDPHDPSNPWYATWNATFYGGDLQGVLEKLDYLQSLGVNTIYFTPIHEARTNHRYDAVDYRQVDDTLAVRGDAAASQALFVEFAAEVERRGMRLILDAIPNHTSSDSPMFDRYERHPEVGACESVDSEWRELYRYLPSRPVGTGVCDGDVNYQGFAGISTLPQADTTHERVIDNWLGEGGITNFWLDYPAVSGWRVDTVPDVIAVNPEFFDLWRPVMKDAHPDALLISETWNEEVARDRLLGDEFDTTMNYRFAFSVLSFLRGKRFTETSDPYLPPMDAAEFDDALRAIQEDYPPQAFAVAMNLLSSHDIHRAVRVLDHDGVDFNAMQPVGGFVDGRTRLAMAALLQFTLPGAPTIFYGDEVGLAGFGSDVLRDDPHNRQPYPWADAAGYEELPDWRKPDPKLLQHYQTLGRLRSEHSFLRTGEWITLLAEGDLYVYLRKDATGAAVVAVNRGKDAQRVTVDLGGHVPYGTMLSNPFGPGADDGTVGMDGFFDFEVGSTGFSLWLTPEGTDLAAPATPTLEATAANTVVTLTVGGLADGALVNLYRSLVDGGYAVVDSIVPVAEGIYVDRGVENGRTYYYRVAQRDAQGLISERSATALALPAAAITAARLGGPYTLTHTVSAITPTVPVTGVVSLETAVEGPEPGLVAELGLLPEGAADYRWTPGVWQGDGDGGDVYAAALLPREVGQAVYRWRFSSDGGRTWTQSDAGTLTALPPADTEAPKPPFRMEALGATGQSVTFAWRLSRPRDLYNFRICRADVTAGEQGCAREFEVPRASSEYTDTEVITGHTYSYTVRVVDTSFNASVPSAVVTLTAELRMTDVTFRVRVPAGTPPGDTIYIAGDDPEVFGAPYSPGLLPLTQVDGPLWEITLAVLDGEQLQYKYTRGAWETVEQWRSIAGYTNRQLRIVRDAEGKMLVDNTSTDWGGDLPDDVMAVELWRDPLVVATEPEDGSTGAVSSVRAVISIPSSSGSPESVIAVVDADGAPVAGTPLMESASSWIWTPAEPLAAGSYTATVSGLEATTPMVAPYSWQFSVE